MAAEEELRPAQPRAGIRLGDHTAGHNDLDDLDGDGQWAAAGGRPRARPAAARPPALPGDVGLVRSWFHCWGAWFYSRELVQQLVLQR